MAALNPKLVIKLILDSAGLAKGAASGLKNLAALNKSIGTTDSKVSGLKKNLAAMWRITGGIVLFNVIRKITHALQGLTGTVLNFDQEMRNVNSVAQLSEKDFAALTDQVIRLALDPRIKDGPAELAAGLYTITSAGYSSADALVILEQAALASTAGITTSAVAADVLISTLGAYSLGVEHAGEVTNSLFQIVNISKYTFEQLASALDSVTPTAAALGITIDDIGAAMATMAAKGVDADTATVQMNAILTALLKPTEAMQEALNGLGYETGQQMIEALGFTKTMQVWADVLDGDAAMASALFGDVRALRGLMNLTNDDAVALTKNYELMGHAQDGAGAMTKALTEQMKANNFQIAVLKKNLEILAVLGFGLIAPHLAKVLTAVNTIFSKLIVQFQHFRDKGYGIFDSLRASVKVVFTEMFGKETGLRVSHWIVKIEEVFNTLKEIALAVFPIVMKVLGFLIDHFDILGPGILGAVVALKVFGVVLTVVTAIMAVLNLTISPLVIAMIAVAAVGALVAIAWSKNWLNIRGIVKGSVEFIGKWLGKIWDFIQPVVDVIKEFGSYLIDVANNDVQPFGDALKSLPGWLQPIAWILGRVIKTLRVFFKTWKDEGFIAAVKKIPMQIRAMGRAISNLLDSMGLHRFADAVKDTFYDVARLFKHIGELVDDVVHGRWAQAWKDFKNIAVDLFWLFIDRFKMGIALFLDIFELIPWTKIGKALWSGIKIAFNFILDNWQLLLPPMLTVGIKLIGAIWDGVLWVWENVVGPGFDSLKDWITGKFTDAKEWLLQAGNDILGGLSDGITFAWEWMTGWIGSIPDWIVGYFSNARKWLYGVGNDIIGGLYDGISFAWDWMMDRLSNAWNALPDWAKKLWKIASPSKVFAEIGKEIPAGLAAGIEGGMGVVDRAMQGMSMATGRRSHRPLAPQLRAMGGSTNLRNTTFAPGSIVVKAAPGQNEDMIAEKVARRVIREIDRAESEVVS
jgi:TP901 family phage tail tape measure protein